jgi:hypothetical protein
VPIEEEEEEEKDAAISEFDTRSLAHCQTWDCGRDWQGTPSFKHLTERARNTVIVPVLN